MTDERKSQILAYVAERKLSYALIAELCGTTRNAVGGLVFRDRHPKATRVKSLGARSPNKMGHGHQPASYRPENRANSPR